MLKSTCDVCGETSLGTYCCDPDTKKNDKQINSVKRESGTHNQRLFPRRMILNALAKQDGKCFWCGSVVKDNFYLNRSGRLMPLKVVGDHIIPYAFDQNTSESNLVASCNICNSIKHSKIFDNPTLMRSYILERRSKLTSVIQED